MSSAGLQRRIERLWYGGSPLGVMLLPLAWLYGAAIALRRGLYRRGWLASRHPGVPVIVVGNVTAGGTGKTPVVAWLVQRLRAHGFVPGVVSRGYGAARAGSPRLVSQDSAARDVGDEPLLLARRTGAPVAVDPDRPAAARRLLEAGVNVIVSDDGLQHHALQRDLEIVVMDGERRFGNGRLLPAGPLREPVAWIGAQALRLANGGTAMPGWHSFKLAAAEAVALAGGERRPLSAFAGQQAWAVAGIGNPARFHAELRRHGIEPVAVDVPDHGVTDLARLRRGPGQPVLMTEKDAVKYEPCTDPDVWCVPVDVQMSAESEQAIMSRVLAVAQGRP